MMSRKRAKHDHAFQTPYSLMENLGGCVTNLDSTVKSLSSTANALRQVNKETIRQGRAIRCEETHALVTDLDIELARNDLAVDIIPECEHLLNEAQIQLDKLHTEEADLTIRVEEQEKSLKEMKKQSIAQQQQLQQQQQMKKKKVESTPVIRPNQVHSQARKKELLDSIAAQDEANRVLQLEITEIKANNIEMSNRMESMQSIQEVEQHEKELEKELAELEKQVIEKQNKVTEKKKEQKNTEQETQDNDTLDIQESISQYSSHLEFIQNVLHELSQPAFAATTTTIHSCESQCKKYLQALQKEKIYIQIDEKQKQGLSGIEQIKILCKNELSHTLGRTTSKILELVITNDYKISAEKLLKEFPSTEEQRHNLTNVTLNLIKANILRISGTDLITTRE